ncbi:MULTISPECIES: hypothetical protein [unclassified Arthrobacter]|uniref:hypothetical protein n=1 Tax=unclassified Arthrobacter TaxID=235627 RepID=UPI002882FEA4|nr:MULTISPECIES: hypothetical protein [unclassified Arthrobacter]
MTLDETLGHLRAAHLMVRDAQEWDGLTTALRSAYAAGDEDLIEQLRSPYLQSWRTVTGNVLRDTFDSAGISVADPAHPWGIATLTANGFSAEPVLCLVDEAHADATETARPDTVRLLTFSEALDHYADCLAPFFGDRAQQQR